MSTASQSPLSISSAPSVNTGTPGSFSPAQSLRDCRLSTAARVISGVFPAKMF